MIPEISARLGQNTSVYGTEKETTYINDNFPSCPNVSIDIGVMEKAENVFVLLGDFGWSDLGTWSSLYDLSQKDENHNVTLNSQALMYNCEGNIVALPENKLAVIQNLDGYLIAESNNVLLICKKEEENARVFIPM